MFQAWVAGSHVTQDIKYVLHELCCKCCEGWLTASTMMRTSSHAFNGLDITRPVAALSVIKLKSLGAMHRCHHDNVIASTERSEVNFVWSPLTPNLKQFIKETSESLPYCPSIRCNSNDIENAPCETRVPWKKHMYIHIYCILIWHPLCIINCLCFQRSAIYWHSYEGDHFSENNLTQVSCIDLLRTASRFLKGRQRMLEPRAVSPLWCEPDRCSCEDKRQRIPQTHFFTLSWIIVKGWGSFSTNVNACRCIGDSRLEAQSDISPFHRSQDSCATALWRKTAAWKQSSVTALARAR